MKKIVPFIFICSLIFELSAVAQTPKPNPASAVMASDAEFISLLKEYTLNADGSMEYHYAKEQKLLTYRAFQNLYGETFISYNPGFQKLTVNTCFTVMADGKKIEAPSNSYNEVLPSFAAGAPAYNGLREMVITHTGLERGAIINLDYMLHTAKDNAPALMGNEIFAETEPVKDLIIKVKIPQNKRLFFKLVNNAEEPQKTVENGFQVYTWHVRNIAAISQEEFQKSVSEAYPRVLFSTSGKRSSAYEYLTAQPAFSMKITDAMKTEVHSLQNENPDQLNLALKIQEKVINDIRLWPIPLRYTGYRMRTAEETWNSMGGSLPEKAVLMAALLESEGIEADPVIIIRDSFFDEKLGTLSDIEDFAVRVHLKDAGIQYFSIVSSNSHDMGKTMSGKIFVALGHGEKPEYQHSGSAKLSVNMSGTFAVSSDPKLTGELSLQIEGAANPYLGLRRDKNKMKNMVSGDISKSDLREIKISQTSPETSFQTYTVLNEKPFRRDSSWIYFTIPFCNAGIESWGMKTLSSKRNQPVEIPGSGEENYEYSMSLPEGWALFTPPVKIEMNNKAGRYFFEIRLEGKKLGISRRIRLVSSVINPENYNDFKALMDNWNNPRLREIIFKK